MALGLCATAHSAIQVTPFILLNNTDHVAAEDNAVFVSESPSAAALRQALSTYYGSSLDPNGTTSDRWLQDGFEIGYVQAPYGEMPLILVLPRATGEIQQFVRMQLLGPDVAGFVLGGTAGNTQDSGGNIECLPDPTGNSSGLFFHGSGMGAALTDFFAAQGMNPSLSVNTSWLAVGHVDEVVSLASDGQHIAVADPEMAIGLLRWASLINPDAVMCQNMNGYGPTGITVSAVLASYLEGYNLNTVMDSNNLPSIIAEVATATGATCNDWYDVTVDATNTGNKGLTKGKAFTAFLSGERFFEIRFTSATSYELFYRDDPGAAWAKDSHTGSVGQDEVFGEAKAFILANWWYGGAAVAGDKYRFSADPFTDIVEVPVLFMRLAEGATAFTSDCINALVDGTVIFTPETHGPVVNGTDILHNYVHKAFVLCGYADDDDHIRFVDARWYHDYNGSIHCGTNAIRTIAGRWWS